MRIPDRYFGLVLVLLCAGCRGGRPVEQPPKKVLEQFGKTLSGLEQALVAAAPASTEDAEELTADLRSRIGRLEDATSELQHQTRDKPEAQTTVNLVAQTLAEARRSTEGKLDLAKLREEVRKLKAQADQLQPKL